MGIEKELCGWGKRLASNRHVTDVRIGLGYTAVEIDECQVGLAYTFRQDAGHSCTAMKMAGELCGKAAERLVDLLEEKDVISSAVGLATLNALLQERLPRSRGEDFFPLLSLQPGEKVGMVGFFAPIIPQIRQAGCELWIFEKNLSRNEHLFSPEEIPRKLPDCSVVILSATTLINHTFEEIVPHFQQAREVVMLGPSTPLLPEIPCRYGVTLLAGMRIVKPKWVLRIVSEGGGTQRLRGAVRKMVVSCHDLGKVHEKRKEEKVDKGKDAVKEG
jgi:uncharacterized protein (DUF4213/DUF364 family)